MCSINDYEARLINDINYVKKLYENQIYKVKVEQFIENLLFEKYVDVVKSCTSRYDCLEDYFIKSQEEISKKSKKERTHFELLKSNIMMDFLGKDNNFKIKEIMSCGYERYAWAVRFEGYGKSFEIVIPMKKNLTTKNIEYAKYGMFTFAIEESEHVWTILKKSYKIKDVADFIKEYFKEKH